MSRTPAPGYSGYYTHCRDCKARIIMCRTAASEGRKFMPLNAEPGDHGNVAINGHGQAVVTMQDNPLFAGELHRHHSAECPVRARRREERDPGQLRLPERRDLD